MQRQTDGIAYINYLTSRPGESRFGVS